MTYNIIIWRTKKREYINRNVNFETKLEAVAYAQGIYDSLREMCELVGYSVRESNQLNQ
jgi:hypothetical protein